jgi:hypothetical protein
MSRMTLDQTRPRVLGFLSRTFHSVTNSEVSECQWGFSTLRGGFASIPERLHSDQGMIYLRLFMTLQQLQGNKYVYYSEHCPFS